MLHILNMFCSLS